MEKRESLALQYQHVKDMMSMPWFNVEVGYDPQTDTYFVPKSRYIEFHHSQTLESNASNQSRKK